MCFGVEAGSVDKDSKCQRTVKEIQNDMKKNPYFIKKQSKSNKHLAKGWKMRPKVIEPEG